MKKLFALLGLIVFFAFGISGVAISQDTIYVEDIEAGTLTPYVVDEDGDTIELATEPETTAEPEPVPDTEEMEVEEDKSFHQVVKDKFIEGGPSFMAFVLICLILGLAICIERIIYLNMASTNTKKLINNVEGALDSGGVDAAKEVCRNTKGPVASIYYQGLERADEGIEMVEKSVISYGSVQMGLLEKGLSWISLFIALAPMLGFLGTVIGMIGAFDAIAEADNISPGIVAGGIGIALITTCAGLMVAVVLQVFYNFIVAKMDGIVNDMEDASISLVDILIKHKLSKSTE